MKIVLDPKRSGENLRVPVKLWLLDMETGALNQAFNMARLPFVHHHIAIMPDAHQGYGMPIGGVMATKDVIIPNAVGVDIGCGMMAVKTTLKEFTPGGLKQIMGEIRAVVPVGFKHHEHPQSVELMPDTNKITHAGSSIAMQQYLSATKQLGTLGGGNHFIEIQKNKLDEIWIMIHSGSRNIGYKVAKYYNELAIELNKRYYSEVDPKSQLAFLPIGSIEAGRYIDDMKYCVEFAFANRKLMMERVLEIFGRHFGRTVFETYQGDMINIAHNYARMENHFGKNVWVHRKGATSAKTGEVGIIPGSQGTKSYIVEGLGNPESFTSCSHGAGRTMGRAQACRELDIKKEIAMLEEQGIIHSIRQVKDLDEAPSAYKDISVVMENQTDLVNILEELTPLAVIKG